MPMSPPGALCDDRLLVPTRRALGIRSHYQIVESVGAN